MKKILSLILLVQLFVSASVMAAPIETYKFDSPETEKVFHKLSEELRCLVCQNQNIAESNADLAKDLRLEIYTMLQEGKSEDEIVEFTKQNLASYKKPKKIEFVDQIPRTLSGKILKRDLRAKYWEGRERSV